MTTLSPVGGDDDRHGIYEDVDNDDGNDDEC